MKSKTTKKTKAKKAARTPRVIGLLTGRGGNTLADKNVLPVLGRPLLFYPAKAAYDSTLIDDYFVSSDSAKILNAAKKVGYAPIKRPKALARPDAQHGEVIKHALDFIRTKKKKTADIVVVVLANSVSIKTKWIDDCINAMLKDDSITAVAPVYQDSDHHPFRAKKLDKQGFFEPFFDFEGKKVSTNRQDLEPSYFFCHNFWVLRTSNLDEAKGQLPWKFMGHKIKPYVVTDKTFDVHDREDLYHSERWLKEHAPEYS
jgi:CMP-N-acetylneuraminic acid synthetase